MSRLLAGPGAQESGHQRCPQDAEHGAIGFGEVAARPAERDADDLAAGGRQAQSDLVLSWNAAEELRIQTQAVESPLAEEIADLDRFAIASRAVMIDQRMFVHVRGELRLGSRVEGAGGVIRIARLTRPWADLVIGKNITANQPGQAG